MKCKLYALKRLYHMLFLLVLLLIFAVFRLTESMCGRPGLTLNCDYNNKLESGEYQIGHTVTYFCLEFPCYTPNIMNRQCLANGSWSGVIPFCHKRSEMMNIEQLILIRDSSKFFAYSMMDSNNNTCSSSNIENNTSWEAVLKKSLRIIAILIIFPDNEMNIYTRVQILDANRTKNDCENHPKDMQRKSQLLICPSEVKGNKIRITPIRTEKSSDPELFLICEVYLFVQLNYACYQPDMPYKGKGLKVSRPFIYDFECEEGYELVGDNQVKCQEDGFWTQSFSSCQKKIDCDPLKFDVTDGGHWVNETSSIRVLICHTGYNIEGSPALVQCLPNGLWSNTTATCKISFVIMGTGVAVSALCLMLCALLIYCIAKKNRAQSRTTVQDSTAQDDSGSDSGLYDEPLDVRAENIYTVTRRHIKEQKNDPPCELGKANFEHTYQNIIELSNSVSWKNQGDALAHAYNQKQLIHKN